MINFLYWHDVASQLNNTKVIEYPYNALPHLQKLIKLLKQSAVVTVQTVKIENV